MVCLHHPGPGCHLSNLSLPLVVEESDLLVLHDSNQKAGCRLMELNMHFSLSLFWSLVDSGNPHIPNAVECFMPLSMMLSNIVRYLKLVVT